MYTDIPFRSTTIDIDDPIYDEGVVMGAAILVSDIKCTSWCRWATRPTSILVAVLDLVI
jgi:hypothetical protein